jgi:hypothetical protein
MFRNDPAFYIYEPGHEVVWRDDNCEFFVVRNGDMRIVYKPGQPEQEVIRYTEDILSRNWECDGCLPYDDTDYTWVENAWFEVWHKTETDYFSDPMFDIGEAIEYAKMATMDEFEVGEALV